ncbi:uncharacterized protein L969DRAFT_86504 [Mixia osmundae IAM 14324]|uniref:Uncharacterized protein n=1 Tax=Mixia osmundae (strain CBS 9802 / IAM 14324 / JCM 22182 / KY 12970) TaxID=764103 RepID=G7E9F7_MIXOS|nr:uncharacterized protein L969DRAFT_86504 [Mixia osmundae IAM 14324]KEI39909.1 hypothetical protein L969DRAFT_86504 [Mixia osmundae IAM 14324]GAA99276.1 hypothetical protein E5Q_05971 [Mixia osmundae IAM 14324]
MDLSWCPVCDRQIDPVPDDEAAHAHASELSGEGHTNAPEAQPHQPHPLARATNGTIKAKPGASTAIRRNGSAGKLHNARPHKLVSLPPPIPLSPSTTALKKADKGKSPASEQPKLGLQSWVGLYCSDDCRRVDELRSRLAFADLEAHPYDPELNGLPDQPHSSGGASSRRYSSDRPSGPKPIRPTFLAQRSSGSAGSDIPCYQSTESLLSLDSPTFGPSAYSHPVPQRAQGALGSGLRAMTPIHMGSSPSKSHLSSEPMPSTRTRSEESASRPRSLARSSTGFALTKAPPTLSGTVTEPAMASLDPTAAAVLPRASSFAQLPLKHSHRHQLSNSSMPHLSCSPSSASSTLSTASNYSTGQSTGPSATLRRPSAGSSDHLSRGSDKERGPTALHSDYALYYHPKRIPSSPSIAPSYSIPNRPAPPDARLLSASAGTISHIINAKLPRNSLAMTSGHSRGPSPNGRDRTPTGSLSALPGLPRAYSAASIRQHSPRPPPARFSTSYSNGSRLGARAASPAHLSSSYNRPGVTRGSSHRSDTSSEDDSSSSSDDAEQEHYARSPGYFQQGEYEQQQREAPKGWNWDRVPGKLAQYQAMDLDKIRKTQSGSDLPLRKHGYKADAQPVDRSRVSSPALATGSKKRLFYFSTDGS